MSKTIRTKTRFKSTNKNHWGNGYMETIKCDESKHRYNGGGLDRPPKMKPYTKKGDRGKFEPDNYQGTQIRITTERHKEEIRNANRSKKKAVRQEYKKEIFNILKNYGSLTEDGENGLSESE